MATQRDDLCLRTFGDLARTVHRIAQSGARELRGHGLTPAQYQVLVAVSARPDVQQQELSERLGVTKGNVSMLVSRLEEAGLLVRVPAGAAHQLRVTDSGGALLRRLRPDHARFMADRFAGLDDAELQMLADLIGRLDSST